MGQQAGITQAKPAQTGHHPATKFQQIAWAGRLDFNNWEPMQVSLLGEFVKNVGLDQAAMRNLNRPDPVVNNRSGARFHTAADGDVFAREYGSRTPVFNNQAGAVFEGLGLGINLHAFFGFDRLMQTITPAATGHFTARLGIDDHDLVFLDDVFDVFFVEAVGTEQLADLVDALALMVEAVGQLRGGQGTRDRQVLDEDRKSVV